MADPKPDNVTARKWAYRNRLRNYLEDYQRLLLVGVDNVGSRQMADIRAALRGKADILMGKNTMIRKIIRNYISDTGNKKLENLLPLINGNVGFVFTQDSITDVRDIITSNKRPAMAKAGVVAPVDVFVPAGPTGMEPTHTAFFQSLNIATRIMRGQIEITTDVHLIVKGEKVGASQASLLVKLGIRPFEYGMKVVSVYDDGNAYSAEVLDIEDSDVANAFFAGLRQVAALSLAVNYPTQASAPHSIMNAYKKCLSIGMAVDGYSWEHLDLVEDIIANPDKYGGGGGGAGGGGGGGGGAAAAEEKKEEVEESSSDAGAAQGMFGDSDSDDSSS